MSEEEAEATLLALAREPIVWGKMQVFYFMEQVIGRAGSVRYEITREGRNRRWRTTQDYPKFFVCPSHYGILDNAKAACERHHATGKWCR